MRKNYCLAMPDFPFEHSILSSGIANCAAAMDEQRQGFLERLFNEHLVQLRTHPDS